MLKEFRDFAMRGNVVDLAIGIIIGGAFGKIVNSLVNDVLMPPLGLLLGRVNFSSLFFSLSGQHYESIAQAKAAGAATLNYGEFINTIVNFIIIAFAVFLLVRQINKLTSKFAPNQAPPSPTTKECPYCISTIALKATRCPHCTAVLA
jgi:large conductance mechanosensitive channel